MIRQNITLIQIWNDNNKVAYPKVPDYWVHLKLVCPVGENRMTYRGISLSESVESWFHICWCFNLSEAASKRMHRQNSFPHKDIDTDSDILSKLFFPREWVPRGFQKHCPKSSKSSSGWEKLEFLVLFTWSLLESKDRKTSAPGCSGCANRIQ